MKNNKKKDDINNINFNLKKKMFDILGDLPVGIDLGTTFSCIGYWDGKEVKIVPNRMGENITPSVIYVHNKELYVGEDIYKDIKVLNESEKIYSIKRIIGQDYDDIDLREKENLHYNIIKDEKTNKPVIKLNTNEKSEYTPVELSSLIIKKLVSNAERFTEKITKVVISVPANFNDAQRCATIEAAELAGLKVIRIINEPTAAALSYGLGQKFCPIKKDLSSFSQIFRRNRDLRTSQNAELFNSNEFSNLKQSLASVGNDKGKNILVFDLGGGTFDLAILKLNLEKKEYEVKSKYSDKYLGGDDFDNALVDYCLKEMKLNKNEIDNRSKERLKKACEWAKKSLSRYNENEKNEEDIVTYVRLDNFTEKKEYLLVRITKEDFEEKICKELFDKLGSHFDEVLNGAKLTSEEIEEIILVGGSTRMTKIKEILRNKFGENCIINDEVNPDEVVAYGATIQAAMLLTVGQNNILKDINLYDITPISLGTDVINDSLDEKIKSLGSKMSVIIPKWTPIPAEYKKRYETLVDNQEDILISIYEGENDYVKFNKLLGQFKLNHIPKRKKGEVICEVSFNIDKNSILTVTAIEKSTNLSNSKTIEVVSDKKGQNVIKKSKYLKYKEFEELKKVNRKDIEYYLNLYKKPANDSEKQIKILERYNEAISNDIKNIYSGQNLNDLDQISLEKYFFKVYLLLESNEEILYINKDEQKKNKILTEVKNYISIFKFQSIYYIKEIINLFKSAERKIFLEIFYFSIKTLNESASDYLNNLKKNCKYFSKLYYEEVIKLYKKYIVEEDALIIKEIKEKIDEEKRESEIQLNKINSLYLLIHLSKQKKKLIDNDLERNVERIINTVENGETGFTYKNDLLDLNNKNLNYEDYNLIYDELEIQLNEILMKLGKDQDHYDDRKNKELLEQKGICLGNMAKIKLKFQKKTDYPQYKKLIDNCIHCARLCSKKSDDCDWYKEALELQKEIKLKDDNHENEEEIMKDAKKQIENLNDALEEDKERFIEEILTNFPYDGYNKNNNPFNNNQEITIDQIDFLIKKYDPEKYPKNSKKEKIIYKIIIFISKNLIEIKSKMK